MMDSFRRLKPYLLQHRTRFLQACLAMAAVALLNGATAGILKPAGNFIFSGKDPRFLTLVALAIPALFLLKMVLTYTQSYLMSYIGQRITQTLREELFVHLHKLSLDFFWKSKSGEVLSRLTNDLMNLQSGLHFVPLYLVRDTLTVIVLLFVMFYINWRFAAIALIAIPMAGIVLAVLGRKLRASSRKSQEVMGEIYHRFQESLQGMLVVKAFNYEDDAIRKFNAESAAFFDQMMRYFRATALSGPLMEFLGSLILAAIVYKAGWEIFHATMTPGDFFSFIGSFFMAYAPIKNLSQMNATLQMALAGADRIFGILDEKPTVEEKSGADTFQGLQDCVEFQDVSFRYPGRDNWALRHVNLKIKAGEVVAVAGPSGSGKTTLVHLMLRLFDPVEGRILVDGKDLREYSSRSLRSHLGLVTQDTILFNDTLGGNVAVGRSGASRDEVKEALEVADAAEFVSHLPTGLDTPLGDRGLRLSGGQRQRIAIARAVLKNPSLLLLDEATSNLDTSSERSVQVALERLYPGRTVLIIAHRLTTLQNAHRIVVLHRGEMAESGTHAELLARGGIYATLYRFQQLEPTDAE
ncbi:MAG: ABC transporter transmembrane domain-containing protein [Elusimicrobiota bacterium]|jgi:subfamily B ATP-binding cassette protein MsbA